MLIFRRRFPVLFARQHVGMAAIAQVDELSEEVVQFRGVVAPQVHFLALAIVSWSAHAWFSCIRPCFFHTAQHFGKCFSTISWPYSPARIRRPNSAQPSLALVEEYLLSFPLESSSVKASCQSGDFDNSCPGPSMA